VGLAANAHTVQTIDRRIKPPRWRAFVRLGRLSR
jgi:hypothetical protein